MTESLNILVLVPSVPFSRGGAELLVERLLGAFKDLGHNADIYSIPFVPEPKEKLLEQMILWRSQDLSFVSGRAIDLVIPTKFPTYFAKHSNKIPWLLHQHRQAYELLGTRFGDFLPEDEHIREQILLADSKMFKECRKIFTISDNVSSRLDRFLGIKSEVILPPIPSMAGYISREPQNFILSVGRLCSAKRPDLMIEAMSYLPEELSLKLVGIADEPGYESYLHSIVKKHSLGHRVEFLGGVKDITLRDIYADCHSVYYGPYDEDYGFVIYEASSAKKPVVTLEDSGFPKTQVSLNKTGLVSNPSPKEIASEFSKLFLDPSIYAECVGNAKNLMIKDTWQDVATKLIAALG